MYKYYLFKLCKLKYFILFSVEFSNFLGIAYPLISLSLSVLRSPRLPNSVPFSASSMSNSAPHSAPPTQRQHQQQQRLWRSPLVFSVMVPLMAAVFLYQLDSFQPAHMPVDGLSYPGVKAPKRNDRMLQGAELLGLGVLPGPEDIVYDSRSNVIYTGCEDGWIKRVTLNDSVVENWINTGGRPLGLALRDNEFVVADAYKVTHQSLFFLNIILSINNYVLLY